MRLLFSASFPILSTTGVRLEVYRARRQRGIGEILQPPIPANESDRLAALRELGILDTPREERFDRITRTAQRVFGVPIAMIGLSDVNRHWYKSCQGIEATEVPRDLTFCAHALTMTKPLIIQDALTDPRFIANPFVTEAPYVRFYAGQQLRSPEGLVYGTLCVIDTVPHTFSEEDSQTLADLGHWAENELTAELLSQALSGRRASEDRLQAIMDNVGDGLIVFDEAGQIESLNPAAEAMFGWPLEALRQHVLWTLIPQTYPGEPLRGLLRPPSDDFGDRRNGAGRNAGFRREREGLRRDGARFPTELTVSAMHTVDGLRYIASVRDISERRAIESALRFSERRLRAVIGNLPVVLFSIDRDGTFTFSEGQGLVPLGIRENDSVGRSIFEVYRNIPPLLAAVRRTLTGAQETVLIEIAGHSFQAQLAPLLDDHGAVIGAIGLSTDVSDRVREAARLRDALADADAQYRAAERARGEARAVLDAAGEGMVLVAPDRQILTVNRHFATLFGLDPDMVVGNSFDAFIPIVERAFVDPEAFRHLVQGSASDSERQFTAIVAQRWPEVRELQLFTTPVRSEGEQFLGRLYVLRDVTHEREVDRMKSEFISLVSHELRTPLTSIKGFVDLLLDGEAGEIGEEQREFLDIVGHNADRLVALINDLLDVSRIEAGKIELDRVSLDLGRIIRGVANAFRPQIEAKGQTLALDLASELPTISGDTERITQIVTNLLSNAHKYTPRGGTLAIAAARAGDTIRVSVRDSGIGLAPEDQAKIFTKFFRARNRTTQEVPGTGLGLAITRALVELHGGAMDVESVAGRGSTFSFSLPLDTAALPAPTLLAPARWGKRILIVDDDPDIAALLRRYLERAGYAVLHAPDAPAALQLARADPPDLVVVDIELPGADGYALLEWLRADDATAAIPAIILSVHDDDGRGKHLGVSCILAKPIDEPTFLLRVRAALAEGTDAAPPQRILVADADRDCRTLLAGGLRWGGYPVTEAEDRATLLAEARLTTPDLVMIDAAFFADGLGLLAELRAALPEDAGVPIVLTTDAPLPANLYEAAEAGLIRLLPKPCDLDELNQTLGAGEAEPVLAGRRMS